MVLCIFPTSVLNPQAAGRETSSLGREAGTAAHDSRIATSNHCDPMPGSVMTDEDGTKLVRHYHGSLCTGTVVGSIATSEEEGAFHTEVERSWMSDAEGVRQ
jgi:hypothetical protein